MDALREGGQVVAIRPAGEAFLARQPAAARGRRAVRQEFALREQIRPEDRAAPGEQALDRRREGPVRLVEARLAGAVDPHDGAVRAGPRLELDDGQLGLMAVRRFVAEEAQRLSD